MIGFALTEGWRNFKNFSLIGFLAVISLTLTLTVLGLSLHGYLVLKAWQDGLLGRFQMEAFLKPGLESSEIDKLQTVIREIPYVDSLYYISSEDAAQRFSEQFDQNILSLLGSNPLPASMVIQLAPSADVARRWRETADAIQQLTVVDEVVYEGEALDQIQNFTRRAGILAAAIVGALMVVSFVFVILTILGSISRREDFIRVVALSGGSPRMAKGPFIALGLMYGAVAGTAAALFIEAARWGIVFLWGSDYITQNWWIPALIGLGTLFGYLAAGWAAGKKIRLY